MGDADIDKTAETAIGRITAKKGDAPPIVPLDIRACADEAAELVRRSFATVADEFALTPENCPSNPAFTTAAALAGRLARLGCHCFGMHVDSALAGFVALMPAGSGEGGAWEITRLAVAPESRHNGYGRALMAAALQKAAELGARKATIGIIDKNAVLKNWYRSFGFAETAKKEYPSLPFVVCEMELGLPQQGIVEGGGAVGEAQGEAGGEPQPKLVGGAGGGALAGCYTFRPMAIDDYGDVHALWAGMPGVGLSEADSRPRIAEYLSRNPGQSFVCEAGGRIVGTILCGNDGRRAYIYHAAVAPSHRRCGIAAELSRMAMEAQGARGIQKCHLFIFSSNEAGKAFWREAGFAERHDIGIMSMDLIE